MVYDINIFKLCFDYIATCQGLLWVPVVKRRAVKLSFLKVVCETKLRSRWRFRYSLILSTVYSVTVSLSVYFLYFFFYSLIINSSTVQLNLRCKTIVTIEVALFSCNCFVLFPFEGCYFIVPMLCHVFIALARWFHPFMIWLVILFHFGNRKIYFLVINLC